MLLRVTMMIVPSGGEKIAENMLEYVVDTKHIKGKLWVNAVYLTECQE